MGNMCSGPPPEEKNGAYAAPAPAPKPAPSPERSKSSQPYVGDITIATAD